MINWRELTTNEQIAALQNVAGAKHIPPQAVEKDLWVTTILQIVFSLPLLTCAVDVVHDNIDSVVLAQVIHRYDELVVALTAFLTAITTTSCLGYGPLPKISPLPKIVKISLMKNPLVRGDFH
jgi:hypothetical protein